MRLLWLMACCVTLLLVSCASTAQQDQGVPPPIMLADTSPDALQVTVGITIGGYTASSCAPPSTPAWTSIGISIWITRAADSMLNPNCASTWTS
jgi:hypothetical protein